MQRKLGEANISAYYDGLRGISIFLFIIIIFYFGLKYVGGGQLVLLEDDLAAYTNREAVNCLGNDFWECMESGLPKKYFTGLE